MHHHTRQLHHHMSAVLRRSLLLLVIAALAVTVPTFAEGPSLDEIIATHIESRGGRDAMNEAQTARMKGKITMGPGLEAPFEISFKRPYKLRMEFVIQGMTAIQAYDGETGWGIMPFLGQAEPSALADDQLKQMQDQADFDGPLVDYKDKGHTVEFLGTEEIDGTEAHKIKIVKKNGDELTTYLDTEYCLEFKQESVTLMQGSEVEVVVEIGDYKEVGSLMLAHSFEQTFVGAAASQVITIESVELNPEVDDALFDMPESEEEPAEEAAEKAGE